MQGILAGGAMPIHLSPPAMTVLADRAVSRPRSRRGLTPVAMKNMVATVDDVEKTSASESQRSEISGSGVFAADSSVVIEVEKSATGGFEQTGEPEVEKTTALESEQSEISCPAVSLRRDLCPCVCLPGLSQAQCFSRRQATYRAGTTRQVDRSNAL